MSKFKMGDIVIVLAETKDNITDEKARTGTYYGKFDNQHCVLLYNMTFFYGKEFEIALYSEQEGFEDEDDK